MISTGTTLPFSGLTSAWTAAVDRSGDVFVTDTNSQVVRELPYDAGSYGSQITLGSGVTSPYGIAVNSSGRLFVSDLAYVAPVTEQVVIAVYYFRRGDDSFSSGSS